MDFAALSLFSGVRVLVFVPRLSREQPGACACRHPVDARNHASRLGILAVVFILMHVNNPSFLNDHSVLRAGRILHNAGIFLIAALPMFVLIVKTEIWTARSPLRVRIATLVLAVVIGAADVLLDEFIAFLRDAIPRLRAEESAAT